MDPNTWLNLPQTWAALWPIISNPATAGIVISIIAEQLGYIQNPDVPNIRKLGVVFAMALGWSIFVAVGSDSFELSKAAVFAILFMAFGVTAASQAGYALIQAIPWLRDILLALFGNKTTATITTAYTGGALLASSSEMTVSTSDKSSVG